MGATKVTEAQAERERVEWVFGLTGGELGAEPWACMHVGRFGDHYTFGNRYWYEGVPDHLNARNYFDHEYRTTVTWGGGYLPEPNREIWDGQGQWKLVASFMNSGEVECPNRTWDPIDRCEVEHGSQNPVSEEIAEMFDSKRKVCYLCEEPVGKQHGYVYIGEGYEAVYELVEEDQEKEEGVI